MLKIKICGLTRPDNIREVLALKPDYIGIIFYPGTKRYIGDNADLSYLKQEHGAKKTAVFVNAEQKEVQQIQQAGAFDAVQLHGQESPQYCRALRKTGLTVLKAFGITPNFNWEQLSEYQDAVDYFLFDTKTPGHGGSGQVFDWKVLEKYPLDIPYFLSGGLGPDNMHDALKINDTRLYALDLNSKFELQPGIKDIPLLDQTLTQIRQ